MIENKILVGNFFLRIYNILFTKLIMLFNERNTYGN